MIFWQFFKLVTTGTIDDAQKDTRVTPRVVFSNEHHLSTELLQCKITVTVEDFPNGRQERPQYLNFSQWIPTQSTLCQNKTQCNKQLDFPNGHLGGTIGDFPSERQLRQN